MKFGDEIDQQHQSLVEHLGELRTRLIRAFVAIIICGLGCYYFSEQLFNLIRGTHELVFTAPMDKFMAHVKVAIFGGIIVAAPYWFYQVWSFIAPGLYKRERRFALSFISSGLALFIIGISVCYYAVFPVTYDFLMGFGGTLDKPMITIDQYLSFFMTLHLAFGLAFELPLILVVLGMLGVVSQAFLKDKRRYAIVILSIFAAIATPSPDAVTMLMLLVPLALLYEIAVILVGFFERKKTSEV